jgi:WD40 repeat protein
MVATAFVAWLAAFFLGIAAGPFPRAGQGDPPGAACTTLRGHTAQVCTVAFAPDGQTLASAGGWPERPGELKLWDVATGQLRMSLDVQTGSVCSVAISPDGETLAAALTDGTVRLWDLATGIEHTTLVRRDLAMLCVAFSPDGRHLAVAGQEPPVAVWDLARRTECGCFPNGIRFVTFSGDGSLLATHQRNGRFQCWQLATGQAHAPETPVGVCSALSLCDRLAALVDQQHTITLWDCDRGQVRRVLRGHDDPITAVAFSPDGRTLASTSSDRTLKVWDVASGREQTTLTGHTGAIYCVAFSADGLRLATAGFDKTVRLWDLTGYQIERDKGP